MGGITEIGRISAGRFRKSRRPTCQAFGRGIRITRSGQFRLAWLSSIQGRTLGSAPKKMFLRMERGVWWRTAENCRQCMVGRPLRQVPAMGFNWASTGDGRWRLWTCSTCEEICKIIIQRGREMEIQMRLPSSRSRFSVQ